MLEVRRKTNLSKTDQGGGAVSLITAISVCKDCDPWVFHGLVNKKSPNVNGHTPAAFPPMILFILFISFVTPHSHFISTSSLASAMMRKKLKIQVESMFSLQPVGYCLLGELVVFGGELGFYICYGFNIVIQSIYLNDYKYTWKH